MKSEGRFTFGIGDFQSYLEKTEGNFVWNWTYMNPFSNIQPYYTPLSEKDQTLVFESRFESGNLEYAIKLSNSHYQLVLQNDTLTKGNTQCTFLEYIFQGFILLCQTQHKAAL